MLWSRILSQMSLLVWATITKLRLPVEDRHIRVGHSLSFFKEEAAQMLLLMRCRSETLCSLSCVPSLAALERDPTTKPCFLNCRP